MAKRYDQTIADLTSSIMESNHQLQKTSEEADQLRVDAVRYRKLKAELEFCPLRTGLISRRGDFCFIEGRFDAAVDVLKDPNGKKQSRRAR